MYSEKSYKNYIFWLQVKRVVVIIVLSCLGAGLGILIGKILESTIKFTSYNNLIIGISSTIFFLLGVLLTVGTGKQVQDGYWRIAVLRKLTVIQKDIELNNELLRCSGKSEKTNISSIESAILNKTEETVPKDEHKSVALYKMNETALVPQPQKKCAKTKKKKIKNK